MKRLLVWASVVVFVVSTAAAGEVGYIEDFSLAKDRAAALRQLIPGTEDYYYYHSLHFLNTEQFEKVDEFTKPWLQRFGQTPRLTEIQTRHALLTYERNPQRSLEYLKRHLNLHFDHQREVIGAAPNLPTALDPKLFSRETLKAHSLAHWQNLDNFEDNALEWLAGENIDWERRRNLLQRLQRPDVPNLPKLIVEDMQAQHPQPFGAYTIHRQLTLAQLDELLKLRGDLLNQAAFVQIWISKLHPGKDEDWRHDPALTKAYLERLQAFVSRLSAAHNALKAHVLYHRLVFDQRQGVYDKARFLAYLSLPRQQHYMAKVLLERDESRRFPADLNADFSAVTLLAPIRIDEPLVREYLKHFLLTAETPREFEPYVNDVYLRHLFAETKIENGLGDPEQWASQLPPDLFRQLKERIDIDFAATNKTAFAGEEPVKLDLFVKNVPNLLVKVFEVNTLNFYRLHAREVDTDINLDGLVANSEQTQAYGEPALRRVARHFEFPQLSRPGVYVIDFIGAGKSSRALVRKGRLRPLVTTGAAGQVVTTVDEANRPVKDASIWFGGLEYHPDKDGRIVLPFSTSPGQRPLILRRGDFACLDYFDHQPESYQLQAGIHVEREALLTQRVASVLIRPGLFLNGKPMALKLLEEVKLRITATDHAGIATSTEVPDFKLFEDREAVHELRVPPRLASLTIQLQAKVKSLSENKKVDLSAAETFAVNEIERVDKTEDLHLAKFGAEYVIELLGRTGEAKVDRPVQLALKHRDFRQPVQATLKTDKQGRIKLGSLPEIAGLTATGPEGTAHAWTLPLDRHSYRQVVHAKSGETISLPYFADATPRPIGEGGRSDKTPRPVGERGRGEGKAARDELALFEVQDGIIRADRFDALSINDGMLELKGLAPGDYDLWLKRSGEHIGIRVVDGVVLGHFVLGKLRQLELPLLKPVQIAGIDADAERVTVRLKDASPFTRVHVFATRYQPAFSAFADLGRVRDAELGGVYPAHAESVYLTGRNIGDEYRYVLDRRGQKKYPGNMAERPNLLLNPWAVRSTETGEQLAQGGEDYRRRGVPAPSAALRAPDAKPVPPPVAGGDFANLDFLAEAAAVEINLVPDKDGVVKIPLKAVGPHAELHVVAVDPLNATYRSATLPEQPAHFLDLRLRNGLNPQSHFTQQKQISILSKNQPFVLADVAASRFEAYDSLPKVYSLYTTLSRDPNLLEFAFILNWPKLKPEEKRDYYSRYASHELHFFLAKKDPVFFRDVVRPYLANKKDKTFLDHWLLDDNLTHYLDPWEYGRLNTVERILLAQHLPGEAPRTARHLGDLLRLQPPNIDRFLMLFESGLKGAELETGDALGLQKAKREAPQNQPMEFLPMRAGAAGKPMAPAPPGAPPAAGFGVGGAAAGGQGKSAEGLRKEAAKGALAEDQTALSDKGMKDADGKKREGRSVLRDENGAARRSMLGREEEQLGDLYGYVADRKAGAVRQLYRRLEPTQEWAENNYHHLLIQQQVAELVTVNPFWLDYARFDGRGAFLSRNLAEAAHNFPEMMFALSVLDLPFEAPKHDVAFKDGKMTLTPAGAVVAFHEEVKPVEGVGNQTPVLISQNFYRHGDRFREVDGEKIDKFVSGEFLIQAIYGCQVVVTNPTSARQKLAVLVQLPIGAIPVGNGQFTKTVMMDLEPYRTQTIDYLFYFPLPGHFAHFPVQVAKNGQFIAAAQAVTFEVVEKLTKPDTTSWDYISQNGANDEVLGMLNRENVNALNLEKIAFRMRDRGFFEAVLQILAERHVYQPTLWSYALYHNAAAPARQYLLHVDPIVAECGGPIKSTLLTIDPVERHQYEHLEYKPLVNARAHALGKKRQIVNARFDEQYHRFLKVLSYRPALNEDDKLAVVYYLLLQDRIEEALATFAQVNPETVATRIQYDYFSAYLQLFSDEPARARAIATRYAEHPVDRWRKAFAAIIHELDEVEGKPGQIADADDRNQRQGQLAVTEPGVEFTIDNKQLHLTWQNVSEATVNYYLMDVELLFSRNPFVQQVSGPFASIKPNATQTVKLPAGKTELAVPLPEDLVRRNVLVEVSAAGKTRSLPYLANAMDVKLQENYGQVKVTEAGSSKPLPKVYVKVYARLGSGQVKFYKDGYTDHRGRFDYASVSTPEPQGLVRFAVLVLSDDRGAAIREAAPPQQ